MNTTAHSPGTSRRGVVAAALGLGAAVLGLPRARAAQAAAAPAAALPALTQAAVRQRAAMNAPMLAVARAGDRLVAVGARGIVLWSDDGGRQWQQASSPVRATLTAVQFVDAQHGWAVGHLGVVLATDDGGQTWRKRLDGVLLAERTTQAAAALAGPAGDQARAYARMLTDDGPDKPLLALHFTDARHGLVVGAYNVALQTDDGGASWTPRSADLPNPRSLHLYGVAREGQTLLVAGEQGLLLRSDDAGRSFVPVPSPYRGTWFGVAPAGAGHWLLHGLRGTLYRHATTGAAPGAWEALNSGSSATITAACRRADGGTVLGTQNGELLFGTEAAQRFVARPAPGASAITALAEAADGGLVITTLGGPRRLADDAARPG